MGHVWLIGMMGTGKTTVGAIVAERLERPLYDTDGIVMEMTGRTIPDLFSASEATFRAAEMRAVMACAEKGDAVIATGGGVVLDEENITTMRRTGRTVLLTATTDALRERVAGNGERPLLEDDDSLERIAAERRTVYEGAADVVIDTTDDEPSTVAEEVLAWLAM